MKTSAKEGGWGRLPAARAARVRQNLPSGERKRRPELEEQGFVTVDVESELPNRDQMGGVSRLW